ncbi:MAG TPA: cytochrome c [Gemmataceae bacterium]|nr:cytochrome c [Gemmataceae bacterium]
MKKHAWLLALVAMLTAGLCFLTAVRARDDDDKEEQMKIDAAKKAAPDVLGLADSVNDAAKLKQQVDAVTKKYNELLPIMWQMKPRDKGGLGVGKPGQYPNDSIELHLLLDLGGKKPPTGQAFKDQAADNQRMADVIKGIASVTPAYGKKGGFTKGPADEKLWNSFADGMSKGTDDLSAAIKSNDEKAFHTAVNNLNKSCNDCHTKFRDN